VSLAILEGRDAMSDKRPDCQTLSADHPVCVTIAAMPTPRRPAPQRRARTGEPTLGRRERRGPFVTELFRYPGKGGWTFAIVPKALAPPITRPWGRTPVSATVNGVSWETSIWRDSKSDRSLLAVPRRVLPAARSGDTVAVEFWFDPDDE
jgi:hypothetical protein